MGHLLFGKKPLCGLVEGSWVLLCASAFNLLPYVLVEECEDRPASHRHVVGKGRSTVIAFSGNCGFPPLIVYKHSTSGGFIKVSCYVESETGSVNFFCSFTLKFIGLFCILSGSLTCV